ncbi:MAG: AgmX/PglI C-terminal domain-containing protein, partial [Myxococcota bacterium]|nr:AgmX/PglI C-terminal domain-containing protein [Myxococcota bacterium]
PPPPPPSPAPPGAPPRPGQVYSLRSLRGSTLAKGDDALPGCFGVVLDASSRCLIHWGGLSFAFRFVPALKSVGGLFAKGMDYPYLNTALFSLFAHVAVIVALMIYPIQAEKLGRDTFGGPPDRFISLILTPPPTKPVSNAVLERIKKKRRPPELEKKLLVDPSAPAGEMESKGSDESKSKAQNRVEVRKRFARLFDDGGAAGGIMGNRGGGGNLFGGLAKVLGTMGPGTASADLAGLGLRRDVLMGGGLGTSKTATEIGTSGHLGAGDAGVEYGVGVQIGKRQRRVVSLSTPTIMGALSRDVVQKVIDRNKNQIRYCYELDLQRNQDLAGRIAFQWTIEATGRVGEVAIKESTLGNSRVEQCMVHRIRTWRFPAPAGGGVVEVHYPFVFKAN